MSGRIEVVRGDITAQNLDAIVNAANSSLMGGGGVDGAIHKAAGPALVEECRRVRIEKYPQGLPVGEAVATSAGNLSSEFVIHTVGPKHWEYPDGGASLLAACHESSLREALRVGARTVAFPAISCGVYGWKPKEAAPVAIGAVRDFLLTAPKITQVRFVLFNDDALEAFTSVVGESTTPEYP